MSFDLIEKINVAAKEKDNLLKEWWENFAAVVNEAEEYAEKHGKPLRDILNEFEPRDDAAMARLSGGVPRNATLTPREAGAARDPESRAGALSGERKFRAELSSETPKQGQEIMVRIGKDSALYDVAGQQGDFLILKPKRPLLRGAQNIYARDGGKPRKVPVDTGGFVQNPEDPDRFTLRLL